MVKLALFVYPVPMLQYLGGSVKRSDEEYCKTQFDTFLRKFLNSSEVNWEPVPQKNEPPDYYLQLDSMRFAVEVTTLVEKITVGGASPLPHAVISKNLQDFVSSVETIAKAEGSLHGNYVVYFTPINNFADVRSEIQERLLDYIRSTSNLESSPWKVIFKSEIVTPRYMPQMCQIQKVKSELDMVSCGVAGVPKSGHDLIYEFHCLLNERLNDKVNKLRNIAAPKILLLLDEYIFSDLEEYKTCVTQIPSLSSFHTVFVVKGNNEGFLLYSQHRDWSKKQFIMSTAAD